MDERAWYLALGLTPPEEEGEEEREPAAPATEEIEEDRGDPQSGTDGAEPDAPEEGEEEPEPAEPAEEEDPETAEDESSPPAQSKEERARQAAARRQREQEAAVQEALQAEREKTNEQIKRLFAWAGFKNGTKPIESLEDMQAYMKETEAARLEKDLKEGKLTPEALRSMIQTELQATEEPAPTADPPTVDPEAFERQIQTELAEIRKYDPNVKSVEDFRNLDRAEAFFAEVTEHGHSFADAYKFVYADKIAEANAKKAAAAGAQRAMNSARGKDHLRPSTARGTGDVSVPAETMKYYRAMMPGATDEEIRRAYQRYVRSTK